MNLIEINQTTKMTKVYILYENEEWSVPLGKALSSRGIAFKMWSMVEGAINLNEPPPNGIFFNRMSASAHTRDHRYSPEYATTVLAWLEAYERIVVNGGNVISLELNKAAQYSALMASGIQIPKTKVVLGQTQMLNALDNMQLPLIIKHNRGGKGLSVRLIQSRGALYEYINSDEYEPPVDGIWLVQQYIQSPLHFITRVEFINRKFVYAVKVDTSEGFELCPADGCNIEETRLANNKNIEKFNIIDNFQHPLIEQYEKFMSLNQLDVAAFEFIQSEDGECYTYDINTNTNYNPAAEEKYGVSAMNKLANYLGDQLSRV